MKNIFRRLIYIGLVSCMFASCLVGCGNEGTSASNSNTQANASAGSPVSEGKNESGSSSTSGSQNWSGTGHGNTVSNLLAGGRYVTDGDKLFMLDYENAKILTYINKDGMPTDFGASKEGIVGYLNIWDGYLYYMTYGNQKGVRRGVNAVHDGYNIYRKGITSGSEEELIASEVSDYSTGFYIVNGLLYYNTKNEVVMVDLSSQDRMEKREPGIVLLAANEEGFYYADRKTGDGYCRYKDADGEKKEFSIGKIFSTTNFAIPQTGDSRYAIAIEGLNYYYVDSMLQESLINKVSPAGIEKVADLKANGYDHATGLFVKDGIIYAAVGHHDKNSYINGEIELDGLVSIVNGEFSQINVVDDNSHILYMDSKTSNMCIYATNGKYYGTSLVSDANVGFGISQLNQLMYEPTKNVVYRTVVSIEHEENIP